ncbi:MAG TPA: cyanophycinase [Blastocatellia bacterium]|nr:cyanophycinase [Blastocatellia bacterium]
MSEKRKRSDRTLIIIGGHEEKQGDAIILRQVAQRVGSGKLVICTVATQEPEESFADYNRVFRRLGVRHVHHLNILSREEAKDESRYKVLEGATAIFFTGGDQLMITSQMGDTPCYEMTRQLYESGGLIAGTSAGASVLCETMMVEGNGAQSHRLGDTIKMAPGFGLINGVIIDQHFAERGRIGRLLGVIAQNPKNIGLGIDENTAIVVERNEFYVLGEGAVYVLDCRDVSQSNIANDDPNKTLSVYDVQLHLLSQGDAFDLTTRRPYVLSPEQRKRKIPALESSAQGD